jgi:hypothetical protein
MQQIVFANGVSIHMENANSVVPNFFNIFGQSEWYE